MKDVSWQQGVVMIVGAFLLAVGGCGWFFLAFASEGVAPVLSAGLFVAGLVFFVTGIIRSIRAGVKPLPVMAFAAVLVATVVTGMIGPLFDGTELPPQLLAVAGIALIVASLWRRTNT